jgi:hypothetical protein
MIKKTIFVFLVIFVLYSLFIALKPKLGSSQHQWQDNIIKAQKFAYDDTDTIENVIIGTSLSCRLIMDSLPSFYNLSFSGQSIFDGLKIIKNKNVFPKNVFIETNLIMRGESLDFTNSLFSPISYFLNKNFIALRADKQPIGIFIRYFTAFKSILNNKFLISKKENTKLENKENVVEVKQDIQKDELFKKMLDLQIIEYSKCPDTLELKKKLVLLSEYVNMLKDNNVNVYFFEIPINSNLMELPKAKIIRNEINLKFPSSMVNYIQIDSSLYETTDGVHLGNIEALKYTTFFKNRIK